MRGYVKIYTCDLNYTTLSYTRFKDGWEVDQDLVYILSLQNQYTLITKQSRKQFKPSTWNLMSKQSKVQWAIPSIQISSQEIILSLLSKFLQISESLPLLLLTFASWCVNNWPIISGKSYLSARHWSDDSVLEGRAFFRGDSNPGRLVLDNINSYDQGLYKCRVDFAIAPTRIR